jgi:ligand-binding sensor domain-containing protein/AraC-like DNA-binding protein
MSILLPHPLQGLGPENRVRNYFLEEWDYKSGFPANDVTEICQTPDGYLWTATDTGVFRYDGISFEHIEFESQTGRGSQYITCLTVDKTGIPWAGTPRAVMKYMKDTHRMRLCSKEDGFPEAYILHLEEDSYGNLWICTFGQGLYRLRQGSVSSVGPAQGLDAGVISSVTEGPEGKLWVCGANNGLFTGQNNQFEKYTISGLETGYSIYWACPEKNGTLWVGTNRGLALVKDQKVTALYTSKDGFGDDSIDAKPIKDEGGNIWVGTTTSLNRLSRAPDGTAVIQNLVNNKVINCLMMDREENLWMGTVGSGLKQVKENIFQIYDRRHGLDTILNALYRDRRGRIWIGSLDGKLLRFSNTEGTFKPVLTLDDTGETNIVCIEEDRGGVLWAGSLNGKLFRIKDGEVKTFTAADGLPGHAVRVILSDHDNRLWIGTMGGGAGCFTDPELGNLRFYNTKNGLLNNTVYNIFGDKNNNIWIGTADGIQCLPGGTWNEETRKNYLEGMFILGILEDETETGEHILWVCTDGNGLIRLKVPEGTFTAFTPEQGLYSRNLQSIHEDRWGNFWITSRKGILRVAKTQLNAYAAGRIRDIHCSSFDRAEEKTVIRMRRSARNILIETGNGELWFSTQQGIAAVNPEKIKINKYPPPVVFKKIVFNYNTVSPEHSGRTFKGIQNIVFHFTAPTFAHPRKVRIKYRLEGHEKQWQMIGSFQERSARYSDLPFGNYTFRVIACNNSGIWNNTGAAFAFTLAPYFYQTFIFKAGVLLAAGVSLLLFYIGLKRFLYLRKLKKKYRNSTLDPEKAEKSMQRLLHLLEEKSLYKDESLTVDSLAKKLSIAPRYLSQIINERLSMNFREFLNGYRVREAERILGDPANDDYSMIEIAFEAGFNSKESFNRAFKKFTGKTPREFRYNRREEKK